MRRGLVPRAMLLSAAVLAVLATGKPFAPGATCSSGVPASWLAH
jgi:hypothetical protein